MTTFGWKRKAGESVAHTASLAFENDAKDEELDNEVTRGEVDWLTLAPKRRLVSLEDAFVKSRRLREEGAMLAEAERYWEAIRKWDEALLIMPNDSKTFEMKAQALMAVGEAFPAVQTAQQAVSAAPTWWVAQQTLGRAQLNLGEVKLAIRSFCKAIMLSPVEKELWDADLLFACSVRDRVQFTSQICSRQNTRDGSSEANLAIHTATEMSVGAERSTNEGGLEAELRESESTEHNARNSVLNVPPNFVHLRG